MSLFSAARRLLGLKRISRPQLGKWPATRAYATHIITPETSSIKCYTNNNVSYATTHTDFHLIPDTVGYCDHCCLAQVLSRCWF